MSKNRGSVSSSVGGINTILLTVFITLKLSGVINWGWWIVLAPIWAPLSLAVVCLLLLIGLRVLTDPQSAD